MQAPLTARRNSSVLNLISFARYRSSINQRYQPGADWGSSDEDHLLPEDRAPLTGASGMYPIDDLDDISPSTLGPSYCWEGSSRLTVCTGWVLTQEEFPIR